MEVTLGATFILVSSVGIYRFLLPKKRSFSEVDFNYRPYLGSDFSQKRRLF